MAPRKRYPIPNLERRARFTWRWVDAMHPNGMNWGGLFINSIFQTESALLHKRPELDNAWEFQHVVASGGFGIVGGWAKKDERGAIVDRMAIKELYMPDYDNYRFSPDGPDIPEEILIQTALQHKNVKSVVQLRALSILQAPEGHEDKIRYFMEYCAYGDLRSILKGYDGVLYANPDAESIPESFLWHLLDSFTEVMVAMEQGPFVHPNSGKVGDKEFILHLDVKPQNVMFTQHIDEDIIHGYPACKVGDWGLARLTSVTHDENSKYLRGSGTRGWMPPEQYDSGKLGKLWNFQPPWRDRERGDKHAYTPAHSVFAFASIIFRLMVVDFNGKVLDKIMEDAANDERLVTDRYFAVVRPTDMDVNTHGRPTQYSEVLKKTIAKCLHFNPASRPSAAYLRRLAQQTCTSLAADQFDAQGADRFPFLYTEHPAPDGGYYKMTHVVYEEDQPTAMEWEP